jgi:ATP-dependent DNA helicase RecQ
MSCTQAELRRIAEAQPSTLSELDRVASLGPQKLDRFGPAFLAVLRDG